MQRQDLYPVILAIDTSCYTTSVALIAGNEILADRRRLLEVPQGRRGLRQAEAVFQHVKNLPQLLEEVLPCRGITGVAVSSKPRSAPGSYMPVFKTGEGMARALALAWGVPLYLTSHQVGHIWAGLFGREQEVKQDFLAVHLSGGTTEVVSVRLQEPTEQDDEGVRIEVLGGTLDIHAGQLIDRIGVKLGLPFPSGPQLEALAQKGREQGIPPVPLAVSVKGTHVNFSGPETEAQRMLEKGAHPAGVAQGVEICVAESAARMIEAAAEASGLNMVLIVGGVAANQYLRRYISSRLEKAGISVTFAAPRFSGDNAVGIAAFGRWRALQQDS
ncbi:MAG TPA: O-sialoglycoprotein endopeptidase [Firmicutes bacterium]|nr:O-sialoglycoprotein endopeptidase [Bacillota bacterium]